MIFQVTPDTHALLCLLIMALAFIATMVIVDLPPPAETGRPRRHARRAHHRRRAHLRIINPHSVATR